MKIRTRYRISAVLAVLVVGLQANLWFGENGLLALLDLKERVNLQQEENKQLIFRNQQLDAEVVDLKQGLASVEERARRELGMIKRNERFYQLLT